MLTAALAVALLTQNPEVLAKRDLMGREVPVLWYAPDHQFAETLPVRVGDDWVVRSGPGTYRSMRATEPVSWLKLHGDIMPKPDATPYRVMVRVFTASERTGDLFFFDDTETGIVISSLAAAEAALESSLKGEVDIRLDVALDPTPIRGFDPVAVTREMVRQDRWETDEGRILLPHHAGIAVVPGAVGPIGPAVAPALTPVIPVFTNGSHFENTTRRMMDALRQGIWARSPAVGYKFDDSLVGFDAAAWKLRLQDPSPNGKAWLERGGVYPLPASIPPVTDSEFPAIRFRPDGTVISSLALAGTAPTTEAALVSGPNPALPNRAVGEFWNAILPGWTAAEKGGEYTIQFGGGTPEGRLVMMKVGEFTKNAEIEMEVQGGFTFPIAFEVYGRQFEIPIRPRFSLTPIDPAAWRKVTVTLPPFDGRLILTPLTPQNGFEGPSPGNQVLNIRNVRAASSQNSPAMENAWDTATVPPATAASVVAYASSTTPQFQLAAIAFDRENPSAQGLERLTAFARSVHYSVSRAALSALRATQSEDKWIESFRYALEVGPFEHNRQSAAELIQEDQPKLARALTTLVLARDWSTRLSVIPALAAQKAPDANVTLLLLLTDPEPIIRRTAAQTLNADGELALRRLLYAAVNDPSEEVRAVAYRRLLRSPNSTYLNEGIKGVRDESFAVRISTIRTAASIGRAEFQPVVKLALADRRLEVRVAALEALASLPGEVTRDEVATLEGDPYPPLGMALALLKRNKNINP